MSTSPMVTSGDQWSKPATTNTPATTVKTNNTLLAEGTDQQNMENLPSASTTASTGDTNAQAASTSMTEPKNPTEPTEPPTTQAEEILTQNVSEVRFEQISTAATTTTTADTSKTQEPSAMTFEDVTSNTSTGEPSEEHPPIITEETTSPVTATGGGTEEVAKQRVETTTMMAPSHQPAHTTTASVTVMSGDENTDDPLRANYLNKSFYHLKDVDEETLNSYCKYFGENVEGLTSKYRKLARLISHYPNFVRRGMERFTLDNLKEMCQELNLSTEGKKSILIDHLFDYYMNIHKGDSLEMMVTNEAGTTTTAKGEVSTATTTSPQTMRKSTRHRKTSPKLGEEKEAAEEEAAGPTRTRAAPRKARTQRGKTKKAMEEEEEEEEGAAAEEEEESAHGPSGTSTKKRKMSHADTTTAQETSISKSEFLRLARELRFTVDDREHVAHQKGELHGSFGWHYSGKSNIVLDRYNVPVTITLNVVVNKSGRKKEE
ncbi:hypothetical protein FDP41_011085 [Naegleria fowleri]|uniref:SAP domain-containing protein n=1 Tax=Naegleria fowleri TaxID=5763 RepID=A0A6A5C0W5_NAEFO|nr:uncharacterized protein FDP41_011085 [Naegleria fowleri]KAF0983107.1 hypothetical protein FDP41_011085 [Naegleria fowleri]